MLIVEFDVFTFLIDSIRKMNCRRNLNYIYRFKRNDQFHHLLLLFSFYFLLCLWQTFSFRLALAMTTPSSPMSPQDLSDQFRVPSLFLRIRTLMLGFILFLSFVWSILLCVAIFVQWVNMNIVERNFISILLFIEFITIVVVPVLLAKEFRLWLDTARSLFLFTSHFGIAVWFACKTSSMTCVAEDERAICTFLILSILIFSWVIPVLVLVYACGLGYLCYHLSKIKAPMPTATTSMIEFADDAEKHQKTMNYTPHTSWHVSRASSGYAI